MKFSRSQAAFWALSYLLLAAGPLILTLLGPLPTARSFWIEFSVYLAFIGLTMMVLEFALSGRFQKLASSLGQDTLLQFHRQIGLVATVFVLAHPVTIIAADFDYLEYFDPRVNLLRALALTAVVPALVLLIVTTIWRQSLRIPYEWWRIAHGGLALFVVGVGLTHLLQVSHYVDVWWKQLMWISVVGGAILLLVETRLLRPLRERKRAYRLVSVHPERDQIWTLSFEPVGHRGIRFDPGQYAWLTINEGPFSLEQHPFSFSSSAMQHDQVSFTVKALGDYTEGIGETPVGATAYIEGPYGAFTPQPDPRRGGAVFVVGGVGATPIMSMLRTLRDRKDARRLVLIYGNGEWRKVLFREELEELQDHLDLTVIHVIQRPTEDWTGESGMITAELLDRYLPEDLSFVAEFFTCGPPPMMDLVEKELMKRDIPPEKIFSERFDIV